MEQLNVETVSWIERARALRPLLEENAAACETQRRIPEKNIQALEQACLFHLVVPRRLGGGGANMQTLASVSMEIGKACASTGWVHMITSVGAWLATTFGVEAQQEVFGKGVPRVCGSGSATGKARRVDGGYRITGRWGYCTGSLHSQWTMLSVLCDSATGEPLGPGQVIVPIADIVIHDTWQVAGMRGTGSNTIEAKDVFVPHTRASLFSELVSRDQTISSALLEPADFWPFWPATIVSGLGPIVGMAQGILERLTAGAHKRGVTYTSYQKQAESAIAQRDVAQATLQIDAMRILVLSLAAQIDNLAADRKRDMDAAGRARIRGYSGLIADTLRDATDKLMSLGGASAFAESSPAQRLWRDLNLMSRHAFFLSNPNYEIYGKVLLGVEPNVSDMF
jgi:alkylation response protein AidB-like acyl-CoA dehydrogenase